MHPILGPSGSTALPPSGLCSHESFQERLLLTTHVKLHPSLLALLTPPPAYFNLPITYHCSNTLSIFYLFTLLSLCNLIYCRVYRGNVSFAYCLISSSWNITWYRSVYCINTEKNFIWYTCNQGLSDNKQVTNNFQTVWKTVIGATLGWGTRNPPGGVGVWAETYFRHTRQQVWWRMTCPRPCRWLFVEQVWKPQRRYAQALGSFPEHPEWTEFRVLGCSVLTWPCRFTHWVGLLLHLLPFCMGLRVSLSGINRASQILYPQGLAHRWASAGGVLSESAARQVRVCCRV